jgi:hypothetical protein
VTLNLIVDCVGFAGFFFLTASGVLMRYVLPPGSGRFVTVWTLDRHEWGTIHFWIAIGFLSVLTFHLCLHWRWIMGVIRGRPREGSGTRIALGIVGLAALGALAMAPLLSPVERAREIPGPRSHSTESAIRGSMTLSEIERAAGVPADLIIKELGLPPDVEQTERLGRLRRTYGFAIEDVRRIIQSHQKDRRKAPSR